MTETFNLHAIEKRYNEAEAACFVGDDFENWCANNISDVPAMIARVRELEEDLSLSSEMIEQFTEGCKKQGARIKALEEEVESLKNDAKGCEDHCQHLQDRLDARDGLGAAGEDEKHKEEAGIAYDDLPPINITGDLSAEEHIQRLRDGE